MRNFLKVHIPDNRIFGLDILRALAILFVVLGHGKSLFPEVTYPTITYLTFDGVAIFFVLSGFLIGGILLRILSDPEKKSSLFNFWSRRWLRTLPNYYLLLFLILAIHLLFDANFNPWDKSSYLWFGQNLYDHPFFFFSEVWSLSVEEWFYLLIPLILFVLVRGFKLSLKYSLFIISVIIIVGVTMFRIYRFHDIPVENMDQWDIHFRRQVITRLDSLMFGVIAAGIQLYYTDFWKKYKNPFFIAGLIILILHQTIEFKSHFIFGMYHCVFSFTLNSIGVVFILPFLSNLKSGKGFFFRLFSRVSLISYSMYLVNYTLVKVWIVEKIPWDETIGNSLAIAFLRPASYWFLTITISILIYKYFELPILKWRDRKKSN